MARWLGAGEDSRNVGRMRFWEFKKAKESNGDAPIEKKVRKTEGEMESMGFLFRAQSFGRGKAGSAPCWGEGGEEAGEDHAEGDIKERGIGSVPVDGPTKKSAVDDLHENEGNGETGDEAEGDAGDAEVGGFGHDGAEDLSAGSASGAKDTDFASAFDPQCGEGESDAERSDSDGEGTEQSSDSKGTIEDAKSFVSKTSLRVDKEFPVGAELFPD
jgi:hypothetical protein